MTQNPSADTATSEAHKIHQPDSSAQHPDPTPTGPPRTKNGDSGWVPGNRRANRSPAYRALPLRAAVAVRYSCAVLRASPGTWLAVALCGAAGYLWFVFVVWLLQPNSIPAVSVLMVAMLAAAVACYTALVRGALYETDGRRPRAGAFVRQLNLVGVATTVALLLILVAAGFVLWVVPAFLVLFLSVFAVHFVLDHGLDPVAAIRSSWRLVFAHPGPLTRLALCNGALLGLGLLSCGIGLIAAIPVTTISLTYAFRYLTGGPIALPAD